MNAFQLEIQPDGLGVVTFDLAGEKVNKFSREVFGLLMLDLWLNRYAKR